MCEVVRRNFNENTRLVTNGPPGLWEDEIVEEDY